MRTGTLLVVLILGLSAALYAQQPRSISLEEAIDIALENNYTLKQAENNLDLASTQVRSEKADYLPSLSSSLSGNKSIGRQFNEVTGEFGDLTINSFGSSLNTSIPIFNGFENLNSLKSSQFNAESRRESLQRTRETVIFETASRYLQVLLDKELLEIARENLESQRKQLEQIEAQVEVGSRPTVDLYNQEATVANQELEVTNRENALSLSR
ncbi:MAG: TolC family protein, partial [Balneolaceae bacterium]|nr:TolC family protein [Balneolaceae bacterium]